MKNKLKSIWAFLKPILNAKTRITVKVWEWGCIALLLILLGGWICS